MYPTHPLWSLNWTQKHSPRAPTLPRATWLYLMVKTILLLQLERRSAVWRSLEFLNAVHPAGCGKALRLWVLPWPLALASLRGLLSWFLVPCSRPCTKQTAIIVKFCCNLDQETWSGIWGDLQFPAAFWSKSSGNCLLFHTLTGVRTQLFMDVMVTSCHVIFVTGSNSRWKRCGCLETSLKAASVRRHSRKPPTNSDSCLRRGRNSVRPPTSKFISLCPRWSLHFYMLCFLQRHCRNRDLGPWPWQVRRCDRYMSQYKTSRFTNHASSQAINKRSTTLFLTAWLHEPMKFIQRATSSQDDWKSMTLILWFMTVHHRPQLLKLEEHPSTWKWFNDVVA